MVGCGAKGLGPRIRQRGLASGCWAGQAGHVPRWFSVFTKYQGIAAGTTHINLKCFVSLT